MNSQIIVYRAKSLFPLAGENPARGKSLMAPLKKIENGQITTCGNRITSIGKKSCKIPLNAKIIDFGDAAIIPALTNAHAHLSLSWLAGKTIWRKGFVPWLRSMVPQILSAPRNCFTNPQSVHLEALTKALQTQKDFNCAIVGDIGGSIAGSLSAAAAKAALLNLTVISFCEWIGWQPPADPAHPWPPRCVDEISAAPQPSPCGHALYSTSPDILRLAHDWCFRHGKTFTFHLAEAPDETEMLLLGTGALRDFYEGKLLPPDWEPPAMTPLQYAISLGILTPRTLAVHGVQLDKQEIAAFAATGAAMCLCPRSNKNLDVGQPLYKEWLDSGTLLCLGTDGLTSNTDLNPVNEAVHLRREADISPNALIRMLTVNGAHALGLATPSLVEGAPAKFAFLPEDLLEN